jgi:hypothetical protein
VGSEGCLLLLHSAVGAVAVGVQPAPAAGLSERRTSQILLHVLGCRTGCVLSTVLHKCRLVVFDMQQLHLQPAVLHSVMACVK